MEVTITDHHNFAEGSILSIRFGSTRRQAPLESVKAHPLKFPCRLDASCEPLKIDVLQPVATSRLVLHSHEESYVIGLEGSDGRNLSVGLTARNIDGASSSEKGASRRSPDGGLLGRMKGEETSASATAAREYLDSTGLLRYVQALLHAVIQVKPSDPYGFMMAQLSAAQSRNAVSRPVSPSAMNMGLSGLYSKPGKGEEEPIKPSKPIDDKVGKDADEESEKTAKAAPEAHASEKETSLLPPATPPPALASQLDETPAPVEKTAKACPPEDPAAEKAGMPQLPMPANSGVEKSAAPEGGTQVQGPPATLAAATPQASEVETAAPAFGATATLGDEADAPKVPPAVRESGGGASDEADAPKVPPAVWESGPGASDEVEGTPAEQPLAEPVPAAKEVPSFPQPDSPQRAKTVDQLRTLAYQELERASSDGRLQNAFSKVAKKNQALENSQPLEGGVAIGDAIDTQPAPEEEEDDEQLRMMAYDTLKVGSQSGQLSSMLGNVAQMRKEKEDDRLRQVAVDTLKEGNTTGQLGKALFKVADKKAAKEEEDLRQLAFETFDEGAKTDQLGVAIAAGKRFQAEKEEDQVRSMAYDALRSGTGTGKLEESLQNIKQKKQDAEDEDLRQLAYETLKQGSENGNLGATLNKVHELKEEKELRAQAFETLKQGSQSGRLTESLEKARSSQGIKALAFHTLGSAASDGRLEEALHRVIHERADAGAPTAPQAASDEDKALKSKARETLAGAVKADRLQDALMKSVKPGVPQESEAPSAGSKDSVSVIKDRLKEQLVSAYETGRLESIVCGNADAQVGDGGERPSSSDSVDAIKDRLKEQLVGAYESGRLEAIVCGMDASQEASPAASAPYVNVTELKLQIRTTLETACLNGNLEKSLNNAASSRPSSGDKDKASPQGEGVIDVLEAALGQEPAASSAGVADDQRVRAGAQRGRVVKRTTTDILVKMDAGQEEWHDAEEVEPDDDGSEALPAVPSAHPAEPAVDNAPRPELEAQKAAAPTPSNTIAEPMPVPGVSLSQEAAAAMPAAACAFLTPRIATRNAEDAANAVARTAAVAASEASPMTVAEMRELYTQIVHMAEENAQLSRTVSSLANQMSELRKTNQILVEQIQSRTASGTPSPSGDSRFLSTSFTASAHGR